MEQVNVDNEETGEKRRDCCNDCPKIPFVNINNEESGEKPKDCCDDGRLRPKTSEWIPFESPANFVDVWYNSRLWQPPVSEIENIKKYLFKFTRRYNLNAKKFFEAFREYCVFNQCRANYRNFKMYCFRRCSHFRQFAKFYQYDDSESAD